MSETQQSSHWANVEETGAYWGMRLMIAIYRLFGRPAFRVALYPVVSFYFLTNHQARSASRQYLKRLQQFAPQLGIENTLWNSFRHFYNFSEGVLDKIVAWMGGYDFEQIRFHGHDEFDKLIHANTGALIIGAHIGNMEICRAIAEHRKTVRLNVLIHTRNMEKYNAILNSVDSANTVELIQVTELNPATAISLHEKISRGEFIIVVGDRIPINSPTRTVDIDFLGEQAVFSQGPYLLAALLKCPVYTFCSIRGDDGLYDIYLDPFAEQITIPRKNPEREQAIQRYVSHYAEKLQDYCLKAPLQWFNFFPFWG